MRVAVPCFGKPRLLLLASGASLGFLLACGSSGGGGLFNASGGSVSSDAGSPSSGGASAHGGAVNASGSAGIAESSGGSSSGGTALGGSATGGSATAGKGAMSGGVSAGGATSGGTSSGGAATTAGQGGVSLAGSSSGGVAAGGLGAAGSVASGGASSTGGTGGSCSMNAVERCDGIDNDCNAMIDDAKACSNKCAGFELGGHGYMVCNVEANATRAAALCEEQGLRLAWIESADENTALLKAISDFGSTEKGGGIAEVAIGATDVGDEGDWHWLDGADFWEGGGDGSPVGGAFTNWAEDRPNNSDATERTGEDCGVLVIDQPDDGEPGQWNDVECALQYGVLCEEP